MDTYSRGENLKFFGVPENTDVLGTSNDMEEGSQQRVASENTKEVIYQFLEEQLKSRGL